MANPRIDSKDEIVIELATATPSQNRPSQSPLGSIAAASAKAQQKSQTARFAAESKGFIYYDDVPMEYRSDFSEILRANTPIKAIISSYLVPGEELNNWITTVRDSAALAYEKTYIFYRNEWGAKAYNAVFIPLGAGMNITDHRVNSCNAFIFSLLNCVLCGVCGRNCCQCDPITDGTYNDETYIETVNTTNLLSTCSSNFAKSLVMAPFNSGFSAAACLTLTLFTTICCPFATNYCYFEIQPAENYKFRGCEGSAPKCCDGWNAYKFAANNLFTDAASIFCMPFINICFASLAAGGAYVAGSVEDCLDPDNPNRYKYISAKPNEEMSILIDGCIVMKTQDVPTSNLLHNSYYNAGYFLFNDAVYYCNLTHGTGQMKKLDIASVAVMVFNHEIKVTDQARVLSENELARITSATGHSHAEYNKPSVMAYADEKFDGTDRKAEAQKPKPSMTLMDRNGSGGVQSAANGGPGLFANKVDTKESSCGSGGAAPVMKLSG